MKEGREPSDEQGKNIGMKIIISHDIDHLYAAEHIFKDLVLEKLWIRSFMELCQRKICPAVFWSRIGLLFHNRMHRIDEIMAFDCSNRIPSQFFVGMRNGLGMSYDIKKATSIIHHIKKYGFDVGVHGIDFQSYEEIKREHDMFKAASGMDVYGIRNHYVRFDGQTLEKMDRAGYLFDSTWFNKERLDIRPPFKVGKMWEFPLHIMEGYILKDKSLKKGIEDTKRAIKQAERKRMPYCTILFHDFYFNKSCFPTEYGWYKWLVDFLTRNHYEFISYKDAIKELEEIHVDGF